ncbi:MAG TPA: hypothetical protein VJJ83_05180 [Candidatus Babeliales bacterium]|nr:hypothetical protein [Candidatus Babeliales bacterium]
MKKVILLAALVILSVKPLTGSANIVLGNREGEIQRWPISLISFKQRGLDIDLVLEIGAMREAVSGLLTRVAALEAGAKS